MKFRFHDKQLLFAIRYWFTVGSKIVSMGCGNQKGCWISNKETAPPI